MNWTDSNRDSILILLVLRRITTHNLRRVIVSLVKIQDT